MASQTDDCRVHADFVELELERMTALRRKQLEAHLAVCPSCRARRSEALSLKDLVHDMGGKPRRQPTVASRTIDPSTSRVFPQRRKRWAMGAAALLAVVLLGFASSYYTGPVIRLIGPRRATPAWVRHRLHGLGGTGTYSLMERRALPATEIGDVDLVLATPIAGGGFVTLNATGRLRRWGKDRSLLSTRVLWTDLAVRTPEVVHDAVLDATERGLLIASVHGLEYVPFDEKEPRRTLDARACYGLAWAQNRELLASDHAGGENGTVLTVRRGDEIVSSHPVPPGSAGSVQVSADGRFVVLFGKTLLDRSTGSNYRLPIKNDFKESWTLEPVTARLIHKADEGSEDQPMTRFECFDASRLAQRVWSHSVPSSVGEVCAGGGQVYFFEECLRPSRTRLHCVDVRTGSARMPVEVECGKPHARASLREGTLLRYYRGMDTLCQTDPTDGNCSLSSAAHRGVIRMIRAAPDGVRIAITAGSGHIQVIHPGGGEVGHYWAHDPLDMAFSSDGANLLVVEEREATWLPLTGNGPRVPLLELTRLVGARVTEGGKALVAMRSGRVDRFDLTGSSSRDASLQAPFLSGSPGGLQTDETGTVGSAGDDHFSVQPWSLKSRVTLAGRKSSPAFGARRIAMAPDGKRIARTGRGFTDVVAWPDLVGIGQIEDAPDTQLLFLDDDLLCVAKPTGEILIADTSPGGRVLCAVRLSERDGPVTALTLAGSGNSFWAGTANGGLHEIRLVWSAR